MAVSGLNHINIVAPTDVLEEVKTFYMEILGLTDGYRPTQFTFAGYWLYAGDQPILHLAVGDTSPDKATGSLNHIAFDCEDLNGMQKKLEACGIEYTIYHLKDVNQTQLFLHDPVAVRLELNFKE
ncbi:glyoxalase [bacterium AH-315-E10]|nr:glyoxalase [bacterium AH-315-E10]